MESEIHFDDISVDDVEKLRSELIDLAEKGEISQKKEFLSNKKKCRESTMKKIMAEYVEKKQRATKMQTTVALVVLIPDLFEKFGVLKFKGGHLTFSAKILADENTMFVISDLIPCCEGGGYYLRYFSAAIFLGSLCISDVKFAPFSSEETEEVPPPHHLLRNQNRKQNKKYGTVLFKTKLSKEAK